MGVKRMIKIILYTITIIFPLSFAACENRQTLSPGVSDNIEIPGMNPPMPLPEYPEIDGSSSTVIMHSAIRAYLTDAYFVNEHSQTYAALERIIPGGDNPADLILAVKYYDETLEEAADRGADLVITPVAKEGFVFILHQDNPVDNLTQRQLRDIYSGRITNWKEVGGKDEEIVPYIRNWDSGSQTAMEDFMGGRRIVGEEDNIISGMMFLLTQLQETGSPGIGYNIYSWSMALGLSRLGLKTAAVDGVHADNKTLSDGSYPLMVYTYSYYNKGNEKGKALTDWLLTDEGQKIIASAGYVGIFGEFSTEEPPNFYKDENDSIEASAEFYLNKENWDPEGKLPYGYSFSTRLKDRKQTEALTAGKGKDVTVLYITHFTNNLGKGEYSRFTVLTRERGGNFEVINEGEYIIDENGIIIPQ